MTGRPHPDIIANIHQRIGEEGAIVTDVLGMVRYIDDQGRKRQMILLDGGGAEAQIDVIAGAGMAAAISAFVDGWVEHQFRGDPSA